MYHRPLFRLIKHFWQNALYVFLGCFPFLPRQAVLWWVCSWVYLRAFVPVFLEQSPAEWRWKPLRSYSSWSLWPLSPWKMTSSSFLSSHLSSLHQPTTSPGKCLIWARLGQLEYLLCVSFAIGSHGKQKGFRHLGFREHIFISAQAQVCTEPPPHMRQKLLADRKWLLFLPLAFPQFQKMKKLKPRGEVAYLKLAPGSHLGLRA